MTRILASLSAAVLLAAAVQAQCLGAATGVVQTLTPTGGFPADDEGRTTPAVPLGLTFPMAGALPLAPGATHAFLESNGEIYLTNLTYGLFTPIGPSTFGINSVAEWRGGANGSPRIAPWGGDSEAGNGAAWGIYLDTSVAGQATIYWNDMWQYTGGAPVGSHNFSCTLYSTGVVEFAYGPTGTFPTAPFHSVGVSIGNNVGTGTQLPSDLTAAGTNSGSLGHLFEDFFTTAPDLEDKRLQLIPNGIGGFFTSVICAAAYHSPYGTGCYGPTATQAIYQNTTTPAATSAAFSGQSMVATPTLNGFIFTWGGGTYVTPTGAATNLVLTDDSEVDVTPSVAFPYAGGSVPTLSVCSNGFVNMSPVGNNTVFSYGSVFNLLNDPIGAFRSNSDYDPGSSPGFVKTEEISGVLYITFENIERWNTAGVDDTFQFQLDLTTGVVTYVWSAMQGTVGGGTVVGYAPGGVSNDPGSIVLATALPKVTAPDYNGVPLALSASPAPVFTIGGPTGVINYQIDNVIDVLAPFGIGLPLLIFSFLPVPGGFDMTFLGMDFCNLYIGGLDIILVPPGTAPTSVMPLVIPQPLSPGFSFYSQAVSLFAANSLPNGLNPFGAILSNGLQSYFNTF